MSECTLYAIDIETVSQGKRAIDYTGQLELKAPSNYKDEEKIAAYVEKEKVKLQSKHGLHWWTGKVISVAIVDVFGNNEDQVFMGHDETKILKELNGVIGTGYVKLISMRGQTFDYPFLVGRFMANYIQIPRVFKTGRFGLLDVENFFGFSSASGQRGKLDDYAHGIGFAGKPGELDGSKVQGLYDTIMAADMEDDRLTAVAAWKQLEKYNLHDAQVVKALANLYYRDITEVQ